jgi:hypothetical protein
MDLRPNGIFIVNPTSKLTVEKDGHRDGEYVMRQYSGILTPRDLT